MIKDIVVAPEKIWHKALTIYGIATRHTSPIYFYFHLSRNFLVFKILLRKLVIRITVHHPTELQWEFHLVLQYVPISFSSSLPLLPDYTNFPKESRTYITDNHWVLHCSLISSSLYLTSTKISGPYIFLPLNPTPTHTPNRYIYNFLLVISFKSKIKNKIILLICI